MKRILGPLILGGLGALILLSLGFWQLSRLEEKTAFLQDVQSRMNAQMIFVDEIDQAENYQAIELKGRYGKGYIDLLSGDEVLGAGYRRITPFILPDGRVILVELGFVDELAKDEEFQLPKGEVQLEGNFYSPQNQSGSEDKAHEVWVGYNLPLMAQALDAEPILVIAKDSPLRAWKSQPLDTSTIPNNHFSYAVQWFILAAIWVIMSAYWASRNVRKTKI